MRDARETILHIVRIRFDRALVSDYRAMDDLEAWAPALLPTADFKRAMDLIAEAHATRGPVGNNVVQLAAARATPKRRSPGAIWFPIEGYPTTISTGSFSLYVAFLDHVRQRVQAPPNRESLSQFTTYLHSLAERTDLCYAGTIEPVQSAASTPPNPFGTPTKRATADLALSQLGGVSWSSSLTQIRLAITVESGQIIAEYQTTL